VERAPVEQELVGLIPPSHSLLRRVELTLDVPLAFHGNLHNGQGHGEGNVSWQEGKHSVEKADGPSARGRGWCGSCRICHV
jgi:hypothetical protein